MLDNQHSIWRHGYCLVTQVRKLVVTHRCELGVPGEAVEVVQGDTNELLYCPLAEALIL